MSMRVALLGTPVVIECEHDAASARLAVCYEAAQRPEADAEPLLASLAEDHAGAFTVVVAGRDPVTAPDWQTAVRALNHELLHGVMLRNRGYFYVHAGVVVHDGQAIVLPGLSQAGKSTLVLALLARGATYLSDELLVWDPVTGNAHAYPRAPKVRDVCVGYFPELAASFVGEGEGRFLRADRVALADPAPPALVIAPRWDPGGSDSLEPLTAGETVLQLVTSALNFGMQRELSVEWLADLGERTAGATLRWRDPHAAADHILEALAR